MSTTEVLHRPERPHTTNASDAEKLTHSAAHATFTMAGSPCIPRVGASMGVLLQARQGAVATATWKQNAATPWIGQALAGMQKHVNKAYFAGHESCDMGFVREKAAVQDTSVVMECNNNVCAQQS